MKIDQIVKRVIADIPVPYEVVKKKDHYFLLVSGFDRICIAGNHDRTSLRNAKNTVNQIKSVIKALDCKK
tara:strand:+ start:556 stop:765 length:210 start_codon:yes stop_codon:yes gene_type:complete